MRLVHFSFNSSLYHACRDIVTPARLKLTRKSETLNSVNTTNMVNFVNNVRILNIVDYDAMKY